MSHMFGDNSGLSQVNTDVEFTGGIGVSYDAGDGKGLNDFGIGLYQNAHSQTVSTGLRIQLNQATDASFITLTLADFDIGSGDKFFNPKKVEPSLLLLGPGGSVYATASPSDIFPNLTFDTTTTGKGKGKGKGPNVDTWDLNLGQLLASLHLSDTSITGYVLYADAKGGETVKSDPYFFVSQSVVSPTTNQ
jgi:hypothetical protein